MEFHKHLALFSGLILFWNFLSSSTRFLYIYSMLDFSISKAVRLSPSWATAIFGKNSNFLLGLVLLYLPFANRDPI